MVWRPLRVRVWKKLGGLKAPSNFIGSTANRTEPLNKVVILQIPALSILIPFQQTLKTLSGELGSTCQFSKCD